MQALVISTNDAHQMALKVILNPDGFSGEEIDRIDALLESYCQTVKVVDCQEFEAVEDLEKFIREDLNNPGCSCGMADYGAPGHDGGPAL